MQVVSPPMLDSGTSLRPVMSPTSASVSTGRSEAAAASAPCPKSLATRVGAHRRSSSACSEAMLCARASSRRDSSSTRSAANRAAVAACSAAARASALALSAAVITAISASHCRLRLAATALACSSPSRRFCSRLSATATAASAAVTAADTSAAATSAAALAASAAALAASAFALALAASSCSSPSRCFCSHLPASAASLAALRSRSRNVHASLSTSVPSAAGACLRTAFVSGLNSPASIACCSAAVASSRAEGVGVAAAGPAAAGSAVEERTAGDEAAPPPFFFFFFFFPAPTLDASSASSSASSSSATRSAAASAAARASAVSGALDEAALDLALCCWSSLTMAVWPSFLATCSAVQSPRSRSSVLAPHCSSSCTQSVWPCLAAPIKAVSPMTFCRSMLALCSSSRRTMASWPIFAASMRGDRSLPPSRSTLAPSSSSSLTTRSCPPPAAACSSPHCRLASASTCPPLFSHPTTCCMSPVFAADTTSSVNCCGSDSLTAACGCSAGVTSSWRSRAADGFPTLVSWGDQCRFAGLSHEHSSTAPASPSTATAYRPLASLKRPTTPHRPLSSGRAWRPPMRTRRPERLGVGAATVAGGLAACCRSSSTVAVRSPTSAICNAVRPCWSRSSVLAPASSSSCTHSMWPLSGVNPAATIRAVPPSSFCRSMLALCSISRRTMAF
eukprot:scaffold127404_cov75-Phaeocystis_antarctica.AAC.4